MKKAKKLHVGRLLILFILICITFPTCIKSEMKICDRTPEGHVAPRSPGDGRFRLRIAGNPEGFVPNQVYIITLSGIKSTNMVQKFQGFFLAVERESANDEFGEYKSAGTFSLFGDSLSKFSERCENTVTQSTAIYKGEIKVVWTAPPAGSGCVIFKATVTEHRDVWFMDDEYLNKKFCEDEQDTIDKQPSIMDPCCACEEAKYELTFERIWSRHTHPKDFPPDALSTRFSDIIGASHTVDYQFWGYGKRASQGLRQLAEHGSTRELESELKTKSENIRTIIKARGATHPNATGKTFAVFRVDSKHHLISLVSMIMPSPDWVVGISAFELCNQNCTWLEYKKINLLPWDAGTDSGPSYLSPDQPTNPPDVIRSIRTNTPNDPNSPFYDESSTDMKPMARLYISRQRLYDKNCESNIGREEDQELNNACRTTAWSDWSECTVKCGKGKQRRSRKYLDPVKSNMMGCTKNLNERQECEGNEPYCDDYQNYNPYDQKSTGIHPECAISDWTPFSECSTPCGKGYMVRSRSYINRAKAKKCRQSLPNPPILEETRECEGDRCGNIYTGAVEVRSVNSRNCQTSPWAIWSPCSETCGLGKKIRTRKLLRDLYNPDRETDENEADECNHVKLREEVVCGRERKSCNRNVETMTQVPEFCFLMPDHGPCRIPANRWFHNGTENDCILFAYSGCGGNQNNFKSRNECLASCGRTYVDPEFSQRRN